MEIKKIKSTQVMTWEKAKDMLIPEAHTFWIILKTFVAKICGNGCAEIYFARQQKKKMGYRKIAKLYLWALLNLILKINVEPYLKKSILHEEIKDES